MNNNGMAGRAQVERARLAGAGLTDKRTTAPQIKAFHASINWVVRDMLAFDWGEAGDIKRDIVFKADYCKFPCSEMAQP